MSAGIAWDGAGRIVGVDDALAALQRVGATPERPGTTTTGALAHQAEPSAPSGLDVADLSRLLPAVTPSDRCCRGPGCVAARRSRWSTRPRCAIESKVSRAELRAAVAGIAKILPPADPDPDGEWRAHLLERMATVRGVRAAAVQGDRVRKSLAEPPLLRPGPQGLTRFSLRPRDQDRVIAALR
ncbi:hypothetical protein Acy02nite_89920 [Actinoplanes cyaneus]|uniref:Uncharacterized protein n=1 Tax=Actinoplanes cyaneus TaxID=52696 RepID=A0A919IU73_9ACTN|nr:hypothetical protein [Actinoplanes cyaneus]MCW2144349.1 hypothetical protein [Actinoplanes cyaneus]GID71111.1 hypothetical protein Acy02nite_89920 [Actinoplanes cyaneus]